MRVAPLSMCKHEPWPANWSSTSRLYGLLQLTAPHRRNELWSCQGSEAVSGDWRSRLSSPLTGRVEIKIIKPLIWIHHSSTATVAKLQWCIRLYREDRRPVVNTGLISPAYCCISCTYQLRSIGMTGVLNVLNKSQQIETHRGANQTTACAWCACVSSKTPVPSVSL